MCYLRVTGIILIVLIGFALSGCEAFDFSKNSFDINNATCTPAAAYNQGLQDGRRGLAVHGDFNTSCPSNQTVLNNAYRDGYNSGLSNRN